MNRSATRYWLASLCVVFLGLVPASSATVFNYAFGGTVDATSNPAFITLGETFSGNFQYNDLGGDTDADPNMGDYIGVGTINVLFSGGFSIVSGFAQILVNNLATDTWTIIGFDDGDPLLTVQLQLSDPTGTALGSDALLALNPGDYPTQNLAVTDLGSGDTASGPTTVIPEPASGLLVGMGCAALAIRTRRRTR